MLTPCSRHRRQRRADGVLRRTVLRRRRVGASFYCSFLTENQQWANISGDKGFVHVPDFVLPFYGCEAAFAVTQARFDVRGCQFNMNEHTRRVAVREYSNNAPDSQETNLFRNFAALAAQRQARPALGRNRAEDAASDRCVPAIEPARRRARRSRQRQLETAQSHRAAR